MKKSKIPAEWHEEHQTSKKNGKAVIDGFVVPQPKGSGDVVGTFTQVDGHTVLTIANEAGEWGVRVMAPATIQECLEAAVAAAVKVGVAE